MDKPIDLREILRHPQDIEDFLCAYGEEVPENLDAARKRALDLLNSLGPTGALGVMFSYARAFGRMAGEVVDFCRERGTPLRGQIQLPQDKLVLNIAGLETGWAFSTRAADSAGLDARTTAISAALAELASRLEPGTLIRHFTEEHVTSFGEALRGSSNVDDRIMWRQIKGSIEETDHTACAEADLRAVRQAIDVIESTSGALARLPISAGAATSLQDLQQGLRAFLQELEGHDAISGEVTPWVAGLADEISLLLGQLWQLGEEVAEGERVRTGFHDFLRTEFWPARWRLYELWLLVRVLRTIERTGGRVHLEGVVGDTWVVSYGRSQKPVATAFFPAGETIDVYYQYWREGEHGADMPDFVVLQSNGRALAVIDPKHGPSYNRSKVQSVLGRYARHLEADLTAIVNYYPMRGYSFERVRDDSRTWILASDVAPDTNHARRLEVHLEDALRSRGYHEAMAEMVSEALSSSPRRRAPREADLVFWAVVALEVDEPAGLWCARPGGDLLPVGSFTAPSKSAESYHKASLESPHDGQACILLAERSALIADGRGAPKLFAEWKDPAYAPPVEWNPKGERFFVHVGDVVRVFERDGIECRLPLPVPGNAVGWHPDGDGLFCVRTAGGTEHFLSLLDLSGRDVWKAPIPVKNQHLYVGSLLERGLWRVEPGFGGGDPFVVLGNLGTYRVASNGALTNASGDEWPLSISPSGRYGVFIGPHSTKSKEGRILLKVRERNAPDLGFPLVRYLGELPARVRWSPDETRFAFLTRERASPPRLFSVRLGERNARAISLPGQEPTSFAWVLPDLWT